MESKQLIEVTPEEKEKVRQELNLDKDKIRKYIDTIREWVQKEEHLKEALKYLNNNILERFLLIEKGSVERTKSRIDRFLTTRGLTPEFCQNKNIDDFEEFSKHVIFLSLPKLNPNDLSRVSVTKLVSEKGNEADMLTYLKYVFLIIDYSLNVDYNLGETYIIDLKHFNRTGLSNINPILLRKGEVLCMEGYGFRVKGVHIINAPPIVDLLVAIMKKAVREKVASRICVHQTFEELHMKIPKEILPEEYGGSLPNCLELSDHWQNKLREKELRKIIEDSAKLVSDDTKRNTYKFNADYMGMPGSFNKLVVD